MPYRRGGLGRHHPNINVWADRLRYFEGVQVVPVPTHHNSSVENPLCASVNEIDCQGYVDCLLAVIAIAIAHEKAELFDVPVRGAKSLPVSLKWLYDLRS